MSADIRRVSALKTLKNLPLDVRTNQKILSRLVEDFEIHPEFKAFLEAEPSRPQKWAILNQNDKGSTNHMLSEWFEDLWFTDQVIVDPPIGNSVLLKAEANGSTDAFGKIDNGGVNIGSPYADAGPGPFLADDVIAVSEDGSHALVKNATTGKTACLEGQCFPAGTPILTTNGTNLPIESIREGQLVAAWDGHRQDTVHAKVVRTFTKVAHGLRRIITAGQDTILATREHPFYVPSLSQYLPADSIKTGMQLLTFTGVLLSVIHHEHLDTTVQVYNFEVEQYHNYFVGEEGVLVHNNCWVNKAGIEDTDLQSIFPNRSSFDLATLKSQLGGRLKAADGVNYDYFLNNIDGLSSADRINLLKRRLQVWESAYYNDIPFNRQLFDDLVEIGGWKRTNPNQDQVNIEELLRVGLADIIRDAGPPNNIIVSTIKNDWSQAPYNGGDLIHDLTRRLRTYPDDFGEALKIVLAWQNYNEIVLDPLNARTWLRHLEGDPPDWLTRAGMSAFFTEVTELGKQFENFIAGGLRNSSLIQEIGNAINRNLADYELFTQVQLKYGNDYFVADQVMIKYVDDGGIKVIDDVIILENKLSAGTNLTTPQQDGLDHLIAGGGFKIRSIYRPGERLTDTNELIRNDDLFNSKISGFVKIFSDGNGTQITGAITLFN